MADTKKIRFTRNNVYDLIEIFEDFLEAYDVRIPASDAEMLEDYESIEDNGARIYGTVCGELENSIMKYAKRLQAQGTIRQIADLFDDEIESWPDDTTKAQMRNLKAGDIFILGTKEYKAARDAAPSKDDPAYFVVFAEDGNAYYEKEFSN